MSVPALVRTTWAEPEGIAPRGTVIVVGGRAETAAVYQRFGRRISFDAYRVRFVEGDVADLEAVAREIDGILSDPQTPAPTVLLGSDTGAAIALDYVARRTDLNRPDAVAIAGLGFPDDPTRSLDDEIGARTACPNHRGVLGREGLDHALAPLNVHLPAPAAGTIDVPLLVLHGAADEVSPIAQVRTLVRELTPRVEFVTIDGGLHDALNDVTHRTVAATVVRFLERLQRGSDLRPIVSEEVL